MKTKKITNNLMIKEALNLWAGELREEHLPDARLYDFVIGILSDDEKADTLKHLSYCRQCRGNLWEIRKFINKEGIADVALPKAAASHEKTLFSVVTESGKYQIQFRKILNQEEKGVINLRVEKPYQKELEGKTLIVTNKSGKEMIRGKVINGETPGNIINTDDMDCETFIIREDIS